MQVGSNIDFGVDALRGKILKMVASSRARLTPLTLKKKLVEEFQLSPKQVKSMIKDLLTAGDLVYSYEFGSTFLVPSFAKPVRVSKQIVLQPPGHHHRPQAQDVIVKIQPGASFGVGNHPTTRLALKGIDFILLDGHRFDKNRDNQVLDIGTGSGVLLITAVLCGLKSGLGIDLDACSRVEAAKNVNLNGLSDRVVISGQPLASIRQRFSLILANLRYPTLKKIRFQIDQRAAAGCYLILSGLRNDELDDLQSTYANIQFEKVWMADELGWWGVVLRKCAPKSWKQEEMLLN